MGELRVIPPPERDNRRIAGLLREAADRIEQDHGDIIGYGLAVVMADGSMASEYDGESTALIGAVDVLHARLLRNWR